MCYIYDLNLDEDVELVVADARDAFWTLPNHSKECKYFITRIGKLLVMLLRTAQGSGGASLTWANFAGLAALCIQSLFTYPSMARCRTREELRL